jgi:hypothetical protein
LLRSIPLLPSPFLFEPTLYGDEENYNIERIFPYYIFWSVQFSGAILPYCCPLIECPSLSKPSGQWFPT